MHGIQGQGRPWDRAVPPPVLYCIHCASVHSPDGYHSRRNRHTKLLCPAETSCLHPSLLLLLSHCDRWLGWNGRGRCSSVHNPQCIAHQNFSPMDNDKHFVGCLLHLPPYSLSILAIVPLSGTDDRANGFVTAKRRSSMIGTY
jgi:hypothetical protein